jgi:hypothetical protein
MGKSNQIMDVEIGLRRFFFSINIYFRPIFQFHGPTVKKHLSRDYVGLIGFDER